MEYEDETTEDNQVYCANEECGFPIFLGELGSECIKVRRKHYCNETCLAESKEDK